MKKKSHTCKAYILRFSDQTIFASQITKKQKENSQDKFKLKTLKNMGKFRLNPENRKSSKETPLIGRKNVRKISQV